MTHVTQVLLNYKLNSCNAPLLRRDVDLTQHFPTLQPKIKNFFTALDPMLEKDHLHFFGDLAHTNLLTLSILKRYLLIHPEKNAYYITLTDLVLLVTQSWTDSESTQLLNRLSNLHLLCVVELVHQQISANNLLKLKSLFNSRMNRRLTTIFAGSYSKQDLCSVFSLYDSTIISLEVKNEDCRYRK